MQQLIAGRYELDHEVGRGGMGAVWLARDAVLGRAVALKQIGMQPGTGRADVQRVEREARVSAMLHHEHVVSVFDLVSDGDRHWLVMEFVESRNLAQVIAEEGALPPDRVAALVGQAVSALAAAHRAGVVHRDVKPSNILVTADDRVKLGDFGIARRSADPSLTQTGMVTGSPTYLAPEVAAGSPATTASDMWSVGATVYHAVAGEPPYDARENVLGALYRIVHEDPPRTERAGWLDPLLRATMVHEPEERWTADQVLDFLKHGPGGATTRVVPAAAPAAATAPQPEPTGVTPHGVWPGRRSGVVPTKLVAGLVGLILLLVLAAWLAGREWGGTDPAADTTPESPGASPADTPDEDTGGDGGGGEGGGDGDETQAADAGEMAAFAEDYLATVVDDPEAGWPMLTPSFQQESGGYEAYEDWWGQVEDYELSGVAADPESMTVSYTVAYSVSGEGRRPPEQVTLELVQRDGEYLIDGER